MTKDMNIETLAKITPDYLLDRSGSVFYSGRKAFESEAPLYILGLNPGGCPKEQKDETVGRHTSEVLKASDDWSAYRDESWEGSPAGTSRLQRSVLHVLNKLKLNPGEVPSSNLIFVRSKELKDLGNRHFILAYKNVCWPVHAAAIATARPKAILCFGREVSNYVREKLEAHTLVEEVFETNQRRYAHRVFKNSKGQRVISALHPGRFYWTSSDTDPSALIARALTESA